MQQQYADDTQHYVAIASITHTPSLSNLEQCLLALHAWFTENGLALNPDKSDAILFGTDKRAVFLPAFSAVDVAGTVVPLTDRIKLLVSSSTNIFPWIITLQISARHVSFTFGPSATSVQRSMTTL